MEKKDIDLLIVNRSKTNEDDPQVIEKSEELARALSHSEKETITYLKNANSEQIYYISEVFDDISKNLQSEGFIDCIENLQLKFPDIDMSVDIKYAKLAIK